MVQFFVTLESLFLFMKSASILELLTVCYQGMFLLEVSINTLQYEFREQSVLFSEDWGVVKTIGAIVLDRVHSGMKVFPTCVVATALLQQLEGIQWGEQVESSPGCIFHKLSLL